MRIQSLLALALAATACESRAPLPDELIAVEAEPDVSTRICGNDFFDTCPTQKKITDKFRKLKKTNFKTKCEVTDDLLTQGVQVTFQVPRMLLDHDGKKDTLSVEMIMGNWSSEGADETLVVSRNNHFIAMMQVDRYGDVLTQQLADIPSIEGDPGVIETVFALTNDKEVFEGLQTGLNKCANEGGPIGMFVNTQCISCRIHKIALMTMVAVLPGAIRGLRSIRIAADMAKAGEYTARALAADAAAAAAAATLDEVWDCERLCGIGECNNGFDECLSGAFDRVAIDKCKTDMELCCKMARGNCQNCSARFGDRRRAGTFCCCGTGGDWL